MVLSFGLGLSVLAAVAQIHGNLSAQILERLPAEAPAYFFIDIQPEQAQSFDQVARGAWTFQVPANCPAQWLELSGRSGDIAQQAEVTIANFSVTGAGAHA